MWPGVMMNEKKYRELNLNNEYISIYLILINLLAKCFCFVLLLLNMNCGTTGFVNCLVFDFKSMRDNNCKLCSNCEQIVLIDFKRLKSTIFRFLFVC